MGRNKRRAGAQPPAAARHLRGGAWPFIAAGIAAAIAAVAGFLWLRSGSFTIEPSPDRNVLLVTIDTLRADALGSYGGRAQTPNLDRLGSRGAVFDFAHAHAVVTLPSHASILTGMLPYEHGIRDNSGYRLDPALPTLATRLKALGFSTGAFIGGFPLTRRFGLGAGFDVYDDQISELQGDAAGLVPDRAADEVIARALQWIDRAGSTRLFAWVHVFDPHWPYAPPEPFRAEYAERPYDGEVAAVDHALGPLFDRLERLGRPTLVVVTSDHGESLGEHGEETHGMFAYEATLRVPLIVASIGANQPARAGRRIVSPARHVDLVPTVLAAVGAAGSESFAGTSLLETIAAGGGSDRPAYFESMTYNLARGWAPLRGVIVERQKYIDLPIAELYDLRADPRELRNLAPQEAAARDRLAAVLRSYDVAPPGRPGREAAAVSATLRSLGYASGSAPARTVYTEADDLKNLVAIDRDLHRSNELLHQGRAADALQLLERVIARRPATADAYLSIARAYWSAGDPAAAVSALERAIGAGAVNSEVQMRLGLYLAESRLDTSRAVALLESLPADDADAANSLGIAYQAAGRLDDAFAAFGRVMTLDPGNGLARQNMAAIRLQQGAVSEAEALARDAIRLDPANARAHTTLGVALARTGRRDEAIDSWKRAIAADPTEFDAMYNLVVLLVEAKRLEEARPYARQFIATAPPARYAREIREFQGLR
jgi:arylsulfatase A-like enzyme/Tfp pilus assembly protein PilF